MVVVIHLAVCINVIFLTHFNIINGEPESPFLFYTDYNLFFILFLCLLLCFIILNFFMHFSLFLSYISFFFSFFEYRIKLSLIIIN